MCGAAHKGHAVAAALEKAQHLRHRIAHAIRIGSRVKERHRICGVLRYDKGPGISRRTEAAPGDVHLIRESFGEGRPCPAPLLILDRDGCTRRQNRRAGEARRASTLCYGHVDRGRNAGTHMRSPGQWNTIRIRRASQEKYTSSCVDRPRGSLRDGSVNLWSCSRLKVVERRELPYGRKCSLSADGIHKSRLDNVAADSASARSVRASKHVIVAQDVLRAAARYERPKRPGTARNGIPARAGIISIAPGSPE